MGRGYGLAISKCHRHRKYGEPQKCELARGRSVRLELGCSTETGHMGSVFAEVAMDLGL